MKPLLQVTAQEDENHRLIEEVKRLNQKLEKLLTDYNSANQANEKVCNVMFICLSSENQQHIDYCLFCLFQMVQDLAALQEELQEEKFLLQETDEVMRSSGAGAPKVPLL